ncbi:T9SS type A sorting domain-containing protein [Gelatiniphilus marinus]|uniref:T9SS type A sorting domain-containing protein n=1 Tax=Gelatiniphilus marinus TaxID=1759464 RepID=A0ABW5JQE6_9FLAO
MDKIFANQNEDVVHYELYDFYSNLILKGNLRNQTEINVSRYKKGIYILKITTTDAHETHRIIIE